MATELEVNGAVATPLSLSLADLRDSYPAHNVAVSFDNGKKTVTATFMGARLWDVLTHAQVTADPAVDSKLRVMARAKDGFRCILRWNEFDPSLTDRVVLIAYEQDGAPLQPGSGSLRLAVPGDPQGRRYLRGLAQITVLTGAVDEDD